MGPASDQFYASQFYLKNTAIYNGRPVDINVEPAWDLTTGGSTIRVAILDDGLEAQHPELTLAMGGGQSFDQMADVRGFGETDDPVNPYGNDRHGTAVAGIIAAMRNTVGIAGIAPGVKLHIGRIFRRTNGPVPGAQVAPPSEIGAAIMWAWQSGADVISNSWGGGAPDNAITSAINSATVFGRGGKGSVVIFSAGNYDPGTNPKPVLYPANLSNVVAVGAITQSGPRSPYSAQGPELDIVAPSSTTLPLSSDPLYCTGNVVSVDPLGSSGCNDGPAGTVDYTSTFGGTSAAAPQVAGVVALLLTMQPNLTESQARSLLCTKADGWGPINDYGCGKLNAWRTIVPPPTVSISGRSIVRPNVACSWTANVTGGAPPYAYTWRAYGGVVGTSSPTLVYTNTGSSFTLTVQVTDAASNSVVASKSITVTSSTTLCTL